MTKIIIPKNDCMEAKKVETNGPYSSDYYRKIAEETDEKIREAHIREAHAYLHAKNFTAL